MSTGRLAKPIRVLMVEDDPEDVRLTQAALEESKLYTLVDHVQDGIEALAYLRQEGAYAGKSRPDLILMDLNMPRKDGRETLTEIKADPRLKSIPVVVLTTSKAEEDVVRSYDLGANCYVVKPVDLEQFVKVVEVIDEFWFSIVRLPKD